jgi:hypothetical protein
VSEDERKARAAAEYMADRGQKKEDPRVALIMNAASWHIKTMRAVVATPLSAAANLDRRCAERRDD